MNHPTRTTATAAVLALVVTGCHTAPLDGPTPITVPPTSTTPTATPTPAPTTASATATPTPTQQQLFTQAVAQYTRTNGEYLRVWRAGGLGPADQPTPILTATTANSALDEYTAALRNLHDKQVVNIEGKFVIHGARPAPTAQGALVTIDVCVDGSSLRNVIGPNRQPSHGTANRLVANYQLVGGELKMISGTERQDPSCATA